MNDTKSMQVKVHLRGWVSPTAFHQEQTQTSATTAAPEGIRTSPQVRILGWENRPAPITDPPKSNNRLYLLSLIFIYILKFILMFNCMCVAQDIIAVCRNKLCTNM